MSTTDPSAKAPQDRTSAKPLTQRRAFWPAVSGVAGFVIAAMIFAGSGDTNSTTPRAATAASSPSASSDEATRTAELDALRTALDEREAALMAREAETSARQQLIATTEVDLAAREAAVNAREAEIAAREAAGTTSGELAGTSATDTPVDSSTTPAPAPQSADAGVYYANCSEARAAGAAPLHRGEAGYRSKLDRDGDGVACE